MPTVSVPHGMQWCVGNHKTIQLDGATVEELWTGLHEHHHELAWRLSKEQGTPSTWLRILVDGRPIEDLQGMATPLSRDSVVALRVLNGAAVGGNL